MTGEPAPETLLAGDLRLDPLEVGDASELAPLLDDPALHEFIGGRPLAEPELEARYRRLVAGAPARQRRAAGSTGRSVAKPTAGPWARRRRR